MPGSKPKGSGRTGPAAPPDVMTIDDLASYLQVSKSSLYKLAQGGKVPGQKVGKHWRFHRAVIDRWLGDREDAK
jgi:excisionase family DNA binding protein